MKRLAVLFAVFINLVSNAAASGADGPSGVWLTQAGDAKVAVSRCGAALCGKVVWLKPPFDSATGRPQIDDKNLNFLNKSIRLFGPVDPEAEEAEYTRLFLSCIFVQFPLLSRFMAL